MDLHYREDLNLNINGFHCIMAKFCIQQTIMNLEHKLTFELKQDKYFGEI